MRFDRIVVGAGIIGLAVARELLAARPRPRLLVIDKEPRIAAHQSGRNSGVIHRGIYYAPGSLKARLCAEGAAATYAYCVARGIPHRRIGKLIVAVTDAECERLATLYQRGRDNGIESLRLLDGDALRRIEPHCAGLAAIHSPETGIVDFAGVCAALAAEVRERGGTIALGERVTGFDPTGDGVRVETSQRRLVGGAVVVCAGVHADRLARAAGADPEPAIVPFRGDYLILHPRAHGLVRGLIYPVPDPALPFLGVHFTPRIDGTVWLGPNAMLAFAREGYRFGDVDWRDIGGMLGHPGFRRLARRYWRAGLGELWRDLSRRAYVAALRPYIPRLRYEDCLPGPAGIRAQALDLAGRLIEDFVIESPLPGLVLVRNAPSPAATGALPIARRIVERVAAAV